MISFLKKYRTVPAQKHFGFLTIEFFDKEFIDQRSSDISGFGMTARVISQFYGHDKRRPFKSTVLFARTLPEQSDRTIDLHECRVVSLPAGGNARSLNIDLNFLLSIDLYPNYRYFLEQSPRTPLIIWIRHPKNEGDLTRISAVPEEMLSQKRNGVQDFKQSAVEESVFFREIHEASLNSGRPVVFATNARCLVPRAKQLYHLSELNPHFLPNPIHFPSTDKITKNSKPTVCLLGRLDPIKRPWIYFELAKKFKDTDFLVCGTPSHPQLMKPIMEKYRSVGNLKFMGLLEGERRDEVLSRSWVLVNTSIDEGLPCSFLEALAYRTPILSSVDPDQLVSRFGYHTGEIEGNGLEESAVLKFEEGLASLLADPEDLASKGREAREHIRRLYHFDTFERNLTNIVNGPLESNYTI